MNLMGQYLAANESIFTDWFPGGGDNGLFRVVIAEMPEGTGTTVIGTIEVYTKSKDDTGDGSLITGATVNITLDDDTGDVKTILVESKATAGVNEMVRYKVTCNQNWLRLLLIPPVFYDSAAAT